MTLPPGTRLGVFVIQAPLGAGGMGEVYAATDTRLARTVALKVLHARPNSASSPAQLLEREARAVAALNHPHICTLYDVGFDGTTGYLVMEHLEGTTFDRLIRQKPLSSGTALVYARQLASALVAAHEKGVIHRDLKPANLFLTTGGVLKVLDFGIARMARGDDADDLTRVATQDGMFAGTVGYAAPEQLRGEPVDHRADIFSAGAVLSEFVSGAPAFAGGSTVDTISAILHDEPRPLPPGVLAPLAYAITTCLAKNPAHRFQSARALLDALDSTDAATAAFAVPIAPAAPSIAVLPFADLSPDRDQEYFCDGMADELITALMALPGVRVASRTSAFQFKGRPDDIGEIGRRLKVQNVLEGSVRRAGARLRVTAQLTDVAEGFQLWSERYDRAADDVFAVQEEIARAIVDKLKVEMTSRTGARIVARGKNVDAYNLLLQGRYAIRKLTKEGFEQGMARFGEAIALDPEYAEAYAALAQGYMLLAIFSVVAPRQVMPTATEAVTRALTLNPDLADGQLALAWARHWYDWNWSEAEAAYRRALQLTPGDSWPRMNYAYFLGLRGRHDEAIAEARRAIAGDPVSVIISRSLTDTLTLARRFDEAIEHGTRAIALEPAFASSYWALGLAQAGRGQFADAVATLERGRVYSSDDAALEGFLGWAYARAGDAPRARAITRQLEARRETGYVTATHIAIVYQGLGDMDEAMRWFRLAYAERATDCCSYGIATQFDVAREDPRFRELIASIEAGGAGETA